MISKVCISDLVSNVKVLMLAECPFLEFYIIIKYSLLCYYIIIIDALTCKEHFNLFY